MNATSKLTARAQVSVPAAMQRKLSIGPGSTIAWELYDDRVVVRRVGVHSSEAIHSVLFDDEPKRKTLAELKAGITKRLRSHSTSD